MSAHRTEQEAQVLEAFHQMDPTEQTIFMHGVRAMADGTISPDVFEQRCRALIDRYRAGEEILLSDLDAMTDAAEK